jgi:hypothetical protein
MELVNVYAIRQAVCIRSAPKHWRSGLDAIKVSLWHCKQFYFDKAAPNWNRTSTSALVTARHARDRLNEIDLG